MKEPAILSTAYFPPVQYVTKFILHKEVICDYHETYLKQSYRNRCTILGANGALDLTIPVIKPNGNNTKTKDIQIEYVTNWQQLHWRAIVSAYNQSPFFEILQNEFEPCFNKEIKFLIDWNELLLNQVAQSVELKLKFQKSKEFIEMDESPYDFRNCISPKTRLQKPDGNFFPKPYHQVFSSKYDFIPNLSIIDLLFNEGPQLSSVCLNSIVL